MKSSGHVNGHNARDIYWNTKDIAVIEFDTQITEFPFLLWEDSKEIEIWMCEQKSEQSKQKKRKN